jgi:hypothetical protein
MSTEVPFGAHSTNDDWSVKAARFGVIALLIAGVGAAWWQWQEDRTDRRICLRLQQLDGRTNNPVVVRDTHEEAHRGRTRLATVVRAAPGRDGHLVLNSEDYDFVVLRCRKVGVPADVVDPAHEG